MSLRQEAVDQITAQHPDVEMILPLSPLQEGLLVETFRSPGDGAYIEQFSSTIEGLSMSSAAPGLAARRRSARAAPRRSTGAISTGRCRLSTARHRALGCSHWTDLRGRADRPSRRAVTAEHDKGLAPVGGAGHAMHACQAGRSSHRFVVTFHHILLDGWSVQIVLRDVAEAFNAIRSGREVELPPAPSYRGYLAWLRAQSQEAAENFWKAALEGFEEPTRLRLPAPAHPSPTFADHWVQLPESVSERLSETGRRRQLTMGTIVEGAWAMLLARYTSESDVVFGVTVAGRPPAVSNVADTVSLFINTLPMRLKITEGATLLSLLEQLQARQLGMRDFEYARLADVQRWAGASADALFDTILAYENYPVRPGSDRRDEDITVRDVRIVEQTHYPITVTVVPGRRLGLRIGFDEMRYERATVEQMGKHLVRILQLIATDVSRTFAETTVLDEAEHDAIVSFGTGRPADYAHEASIARLVERHAAAHPSAPAVTWGSDVLTYAALNQRANQLAHHLRRLGIRRGAHVAISVERGPTLIVGLLAILKAGAAYVPLDPGYPAQRLAFMLEDTVPPVLLTERRLVEAVPQFAGHVVCLDDDVDAIQSEPDENLADAATGLDVAYVIYTSGSTGRPKGVCVPHQAITRLVWNADYAPLSPSDVVAQASNASFDASTFEIWGALINGAKLVGVPKDIMLSPVSLGRHLEEHGVTALFLTTALFNQVARERPDAFAGVRHLMFGGEAVDPRAALAVLNAIPPRRLLHVYGPTENTTFSTWFEIERVAEHATTIPIGRAIANSTVYVLDRTLQLVPVGVTGEVFVGGEGLAAGYLNQPALTAERFVPSPFGAGERLYRTGDLGRWTPDGQIEFIGRTDEQVKIRGFRIEPGEIEASLAAHHAVRAAAVLARETVPGVKRLVVYVVAGEPGVLDVAEVRAFLKARLPDYMMPSAIIEIPALPLNASTQAGSPGAAPAGRDARWVDSAARIRRRDRPRGDLARSVARRASRCRRQFLRPRWRFHPRDSGLLALDASRLARHAKAVVREPVGGRTGGGCKKTRGRFIGRRGRGSDW